MQIMDSRTAISAALLTLVLSTPAFSQTTVNEPVSLSGPRFGFTMLSDGIVKKLDEHSIKVGSMISQFGWQFEKRFYSGEHGLTALNEWVLLVGGVEQGVALPSVSWLMGLRTGNGVEFGVGPNVTPVGVGMAASVGITIPAGALHVPLNFAVVHSKSGMRVSMLTGFNMGR